MKKATSPKFDKEGYQKGKPNLVGEEIDFDVISRTKPLNRAQISALGLPSPEELASRKTGTKVSLVVDDDALAFFKEEAKRLDTSYQRMMRTLISAYVDRVRSHRALKSGHH